jgi:hypothetical protein
MITLPASVSLVSGGEGAFLEACSGAASDDIRSDASNRMMFSPAGALVCSSSFILKILHVDLDGTETEYLQVHVIYAVSECFRRP